MIFININTVFKDAFTNKNVCALETILSSSDSRINIIKEFANKENINEFRKVLAKFKSKGLKKDIEDYCDLIESKYLKQSNKNDGLKSIIIKCVNEKNIKINKVKYLKDDTFSKTRVNNYI
ncbi:hypothetical protein LPB137_07865 [Poseidonibacter parvus]|uniref:Uncharacterized protein n=1 Tax=Poseidonibacter parvus TaxID=1850254 RepID=A0A1P8KMM9_9BACT|nr:hypothetical protein [Poseidonibacter parvus]APW65773.1 hypothetical protein LPB137_07865 [Poseidonibacter parvus]